MPSPIHEFDETRPEYKGFNKYYAKSILPLLESKEIDRVARVKKAKKTAAIITAMLVGITALIFSRTGSLIVGGIGLVFSILAWFITPNIMLSKIKGETKEFLMRTICGFLGWTFKVDDFESPDLDIWRANRLLPNYDRSDFEDQMQGEHHGAHFALCEAHLETKHTDSDGDTTWRTAFQGVILTIDFQREFFGRTVVLRDAGMFNFKKKAGMKRVGLVDPVFEKIFEAYSTDQVESRYLLTPTFMQRLVDLEKSVKGKRIRFGFMEGKLHIAIEAPNQFESGSMFKPLINTERTEKILEELGYILDIIDGVIKPLDKHQYT